MFNNIMHSIINAALKSNSITLNRLGNSLYVYNQMRRNRYSMICASYEHGEDDMSNMLTEMRLLIDGKYAGNKEYLFARLDFLIEQGFMHNLRAQMAREKRITANGKNIKELATKRRSVRRDALGRFITKSLRK